MYRLFNLCTRAIILICLSCLILPTIGYADDADIIWVQKSQRLLHIVKDYQITDTYPIALGKNPFGHKSMEGDSRTPEGVYYIDGRNLRSNFFLSLHISYPAPRDSLRAIRNNVSPGKHIMIHGEPNDPDRQTSVAGDWTDGCIALSNENMLAVWEQVADGTPIIIDP